MGEDHKSQEWNRKRNIRRRGIAYEKEERLEERDHKSPCFRQRSMKRGKEEWTQGNWNGLLMSIRKKTVEEEEEGKKKTNE